MQNSEKKMFACTHEDCNSVFDRPYRLQQHKFVHSDIKQFLCTEENCAKSYTSKSHLDRHINSAHKKKESDIIYSCLECKKKYANRQNLKRHIKRNHTNVSNTFLCDICKRNFKKKNQLSAHMFQHNGIKAFSCDLCSIDFISLYDKKKHMRNHKTYACEHCPEKFDRWSHYVKHNRTNHTLKEYICDDCGKNFKKKSHILRHIKTHSQVLVRSFLCPFENCQRRYSRNSNLTQHIMMKHEKITHQCTICNAQLCTKAKLDNHIMKIHNSKEVKRRIPKTLETGRSTRRDKNSLKLIAALKLSGLKTKPEAVDINKSRPATTEILPNLIRSDIGRT